MNTETYRDSHTQSGYGAAYEDAYSESTYYGQLWRQIERPLVSSNLAQLRSEGADRCLDFACGTGRILEVNTEVFEDVTGVDVSEAMMHVASQKCPTAKILCQDITQSPLPDKFDVVTAFRFFRNAEDSLRLDALQAIKNHLTPQGCLVANIHGNPYSPGMLALTAKSIFKKSAARTISRSTFIDLLESNGFEVVKMVDYSYLPRVGGFFPQWCRHLMKPADKWLAKIPILNKTSESTLFIARLSQTS